MSNHCHARLPPKVGVAPTADGSVKRMPADNVHGPRVREEVSIAESANVRNLHFDTASIWDNLDNGMECPMSMTRSSRSGSTVQRQPGWGFEPRWPLHACVLPRGS